MKSVFLVFSTLLFWIVEAEATEKITWYNFQKVTTLQKEAPKKILIDVYTDWCGWCKKMDASTFQHPVIIDLLNKYFYSVKLNAEKEDTIFFGGKKYHLQGQGRSTHTLASQLLNGRMSYPTTVFLDETLHSLGPVPGYLDAATMEKILVYFGENHYRNMEWKVFEKNFKGKIIVEEHGY